MGVSFSFSISTPSSPAPVVPGAESGAQAGRDFALDAQENLLLVEGDLVLLSGAEAVASDLKARLQTFAGEWFLDSRIGVPYATDVFGKQNQARVAAVLRAAILETPGVAEIQAFSVRQEGRTLTVAFAVSTDFGEIIEATLEA